MTDVLSDPNTLNLVIQIDLTGAAVDRYGPQTALAFAIDPSIQPNVIHYFWSKSRSYALSYLSASAGGVTGTLVKNCTDTVGSLSVWAGQLNWTPLFAAGNAYYALTVQGQNFFGGSSYNVAGTWGD